MLIGVMRRPSTRPTGASSANYQFRVLLRGDVLPRTDERSSLQGTMTTLRAFREEWHQNEAVLVSLTG